VFDEGVITPMKGDPMKIHLKEGPIKPTRVLTARQIPIYMREDAQKTLQKALDSGIIVPVAEPTEWISPAFFVPKPKGGARLVCDFIPAILAAFGAAASVAGAAGGVAKAVNDKKHNDRTESEAKRHNKEVENLLKATKAMKIGKGKQGSGAYLPKKNGKGGFLPKRG